LFMPLSNLIGLSNSQNLSNAFNSLVFSVVGCVSIFLFVLVQPISNTNNIIKLYFITNLYIITINWIFY